MGFGESRQDITATIKEQTDIVKIIGEHVDLKRSGVRYLGLCPFHGEKTPSFSVHSAQQFYYCFGCGASGDVFSFLMKYHNYDFPEALKYLADRLNIELPKRNISKKERDQEERREKMYAVTAKAARIYRSNLLDEQTSGAARNYLHKRGIPSEIQERFGVGYAPASEQGGWNYLTGKLSAEESKNAERVGLLVKKERGGYYDRFRDRVLFPIYDIRGRVCGFGGRIIGEGQPKYMNSPESPIFNKSRNLLGLYQQADTIRKKRRVIIVEGNFDMISLVVHGCDHVVAPLGTSLTSSQIRLLKKYADQVILLFDGDQAGVKAALRTAPLFLTEQLAARVALLPNDDDPDTFVRREGLAKLNGVLEEAGELPEFVLEQLVITHGLTLEGKSRIAEDIKPLLAAAASPLQRSVVASHVAERLGISATHLEESVTKTDALGRGQRHQQGAESHSSASPVVQLQTPLTAAQRRLIEFMVLHLQFFRDLDDKNIRQALQGGVGEIIYLQIKSMLTADTDAQPEEILQVLPEGPERKIVAEILINAAKSVESDQLKEQLNEVLEWLDIQRLRRRSQEISGEIARAQQTDDFTTLALLLEEKQKIETEMRKLR